MHTYACAHTQSNTSLCLPTLSDPLLVAVLSLYWSPILLCTWESTVVLGAPGIMEPHAQGQKSTGRMLPVFSATLLQHTLTKSPSLYLKKAAALHVTPAILPRGILRWLEA